MIISASIRASCGPTSRQPLARVAAKKEGKLWGVPKIHMAVDALGRPLKLILTPGQRGDEHQQKADFLDSVLARTQV